MALSVKQFIFETKISQTVFLSLPLILKHVVLLLGKALC